MKSGFVRSGNAVTRVPQCIRGGRLIKRLAVILQKSEAPKQQQRLQLDQAAKSDWMLYLPKSGTMQGYS